MVKTSVFYNLKIVNFIFKGRTTDEFLIIALKIREIKFNENKIVQ